MQEVTWLASATLASCSYAFLRSTRKEKSWDSFQLLISQIYQRAGCLPKEQKTKISPCTALEPQDDAFPPVGEVVKQLLETSALGYLLAKITKGLKIKTKILATTYY